MNDSIYVQVYQLQQYIMRYSIIGLTNKIHKTLRIIIVLKLIIKKKSLTDAITNNATRAQFHGCKFQPKFKIRHKVR